MQTNAGLQSIKYRLSVMHVSREFPPCGEVLVTHKTLLVMQALELFLDCCRHRAVQPLAAAAKGGLSASDLQDLLTKLAATVQVSCQHCTSRCHRPVVARCAFDVLTVVA